MNVLYRRGMRLLFAASICLGLAACGESGETRRALDPVAFHGDDECHVCGMLISDFPGPKGEAVEKGGVRKFCSTAEMLGWWLQPENQLLDARLYVHDMARSHWDRPDDAYLIDAFRAYYVIGTSRRGAMGPALASFANEQDARKLADEEGGRVLRFEEIDQHVLQQATATQHGGMHGHDHGDQGVR